MATFGDDLDTDRDAVFLDATGYGYGTSATYTTIATGVESAITVVEQELEFSIYDPKQNAKFSVSADDVANPVPGDLITHDGNVWSVLNIKTLNGVHELSAILQVEYM